MKRLAKNASFSAKIKSWLGPGLLYGISLGLLQAALEFSKYRLTGWKDGTEWRMGAVALLFVILGAWAGSRWGKQGERAVAPVVPAALPEQALLDKWGITQREWEVLTAMANGLSNQEIAEQLYVSLNTVKTHVSNIFSKLGVQRRTQAVQRGKELGLLP
jgi:DNA-binding CsgD family transcriptional regulator